MLGQRLVIHHKPAAQINQARAFLHPLEFVLGKQVPILRLAVHVQRDHIRCLQQFTKAHRPRIAPRQHVRDIVEHHPHAQRFRQVRNLRPNLSVAHDPQRQPAHLVRSRRGFVPHPTVHLAADFERPPQQQDDFPQRQFRHRSAVRVRIVEHRDAPVARRGAVNFVHSDAERSDRHQFRRRLQHRRCDPRLRPNPQDHRLAHLPDQFRLFQRALQRLNPVARLLKLRNCHSADVFQQQNLQEPSQMQSRKR